MGGIIKIGAFLGVGYYLYKNWDSFSKMMPTAVAAPAAAIVPGASTTVTVAPVLTTADASTLRQKIQQYLATDPGFPKDGATYDQWNWIRWKYMSAPESQGDIFPGTPQDTIITLVRRGWSRRRIASELRGPRYAVRYAKIAAAEPASPSSRATDAAAPGRIPARLP